MLVLAVITLISTVITGHLFTSDFTHIHVVTELSFTLAHPCSCRYHVVLIPYSFLVTYLKNRVTPLSLLKYNLLGHLFRRFVISDS